MSRTVVLVVLDGWGVGDHNRGNPIYSQRPQSIEYCRRHFPAGALQASGIAVGLPWEEAGSSEISHLVIGAGRTVYQPYPRISLAVRDGSFFSNPTLLAAADHATASGGSLHLVGLLSESNSDASREHLDALIKFTSDRSLPYWLHLITDGVDSSRSATDLISTLPDPSRVISLFGRYYAMDEDDHWDRIGSCYRALTDPAVPSLEISTLFTASRASGGDQYIAPSPVNAHHPVKDGDALIFFNFREDGLRELVSPFADPQFSEFKTVSFSNLFVATFSRYSRDFKATVAFETDLPQTPLGRVLSAAGKTQLKIGETIKYSSLTYFFNGFREAPYKNEYRVLIPSTSTPHPESSPALRAADITARALQSINERAFDFIVVNYANPDIIGRTGNLTAAEDAVRVLDGELNKIIRASLESGATLIIMGSHGNMERMVNPLTGESETGNTANPVPIYLLGREFQTVKNDIRLSAEEQTTSGIISDVSPMILKLFDISLPSDMTDSNLLKLLQNP